MFTTNQWMKCPFEANCIKLVFESNVDQVRWRHVNNLSNVWTYPLSEDGTQLVFGTSTLLDDGYEIFIQSEKREIAATLHYQYWRNFALE